ncbi:MAG: NUDIX hydrolase [Candidatus Pacearchaeota archaeon]|nr:NUDIX hydrolase [Candidatus Pacearchaeota archaeon]
MDEKRFGLGTVLYVFSQDLSRVLLLKLNEHKRVKFGADWGNVGGKINLGETSLENCIRESGEEIGVRFEPRDLRLLYVKEIPNFFNKVHAVQFVYGAALDEQTPIILGKELESYRWFDLSKLPERTLDTQEDFYYALSQLRNSFKASANL